MYHPTPPQRALYTLALEIYASTAQMTWQKAYAMARLRISRQKSTKPS